ncbi:MAG TPA: TRAP transporter small permease subunit, partial [Planctomycetota bacterium]|nr:TRAP transporter small permease subunit [Planctomycetota bacterium]
MSALRLRWSAVENASLAGALALVALVPLVESALRAVLHVGIPGAASLAQHCALLAGMLGAVVAAREQRLLALSTSRAALAGVVATVVCALLALGAAQFVLAEHDAGNSIIPGLPSWLGQAALPLGFGLMALRFVLQLGGPWQARAAAAAVAALVLAAAGRGWPLGSAALACALAAVLAGAVLGTPVFITLGGAALFLFWADGLPIAALALDHYRMV